MIIKKFELNNFIDKEKTITFINDYNIVYSEKNSTGKTTFLRSLLYSLGFSIPNTQKVKFSNYQFLLEIEVNGNIKNIVRNKSFIKVNNVEFVLPAETNSVLSEIFEIDNIELLKNLLGCFYIDQEKGWTLLNRGVVIGDIRFYIEDFLRGLNDKNNIKEKLELAKVNSEINKYKQMWDISEYQKQLNIADNQLTYETYDETLEKRKQILNHEKNRLKEKINQLEDSVNDNNRFIQFIERMNLYINIGDDNKIKVSKENIDGLMDIAQLAEAELRTLKLQYRDILNQEVELLQESNKNNTLISVKSILDEFNEYIAKIPLNATNIENVLKRLNKRRKELNELIKENTKVNNEWVKFLYETIFKYAKKLDMLSYIEEKENFIFTNELKGYSGAILHKLVFIFKLAYIKALSLKTKIKFPIIIDSPSGREVEKETVQAMIDLLEEEFNEHQIIIATINEFQYKRNKNIIKMDGKLFSIIGITENED